MIPDVISARHIDNYKIEVSFDDGTKGIVDLSKYLKMAGVFVFYQHQNNRNAKPWIEPKRKGITDFDWLILKTMLI